MGELQTGDAVDGIRFDVENGPATFQNFPGDWADLNCSCRCQPRMRGCDIIMVYHFLPATLCYFKSFKSSVGFHLYPTIDILIDFMEREV